MNETGPRWAARLVTRTTLLLCLLAGLTGLTGLVACGERSTSAAKIGGAAKTAPAAAAAATADKTAAKEQTAGRAAARAAADRAAATKARAAQVAALKAAARAKRKAAEKERNKPQRIGGVSITERDEGPWKVRTLPGTRAAFVPAKPDTARPRSALDDNADFPAFERYLTTWKSRPEAAAQFKYLKVTGRRSVHVRDVKGVAVPMAVVDLAQGGHVVWRARTYGDGRFFFYPAMARAKPGQPWSASTIALASRGKGVLAADGAEVTLKLPGEQPTDTMQLDVAIVVDTTASMAPALKGLQTALLSALKRLDGLGEKVDLRIGAVAYRDAGEPYLTKKLAMDPNLTQFLQRIAALQGAGGGDVPDALDQGLYVAIDRLTWRRSSAKVVFVLTDAAPKPSTAGDQDHTVSAIRAAAMGIRVHTLALAGHDAMATLALRQIAQMACGQFIPLPKPTDKALPATLADAVFERLKTEVTRWTKPPK